MIKRFLFFVVVNLFLGLFASAQVYYTYDSLTNKVTYENCREYVGQMLYMLPKSNIYEMDKTNGYKGYQFPSSLIYSSDRVYNPFTRFTLSPNAIYTAQNIYKPNGGTKTFCTSDYNAIAGKYFKVIDVIDKTRELDGDRYQGVFFKLVSQENGDTLYYQLSENGSSQSVAHGLWVCVGYLEKLKKTLINKAFIAQQNFSGLYGVHSETSVACSTGSEWVCSDVFLMETKKYFPVLLAAIFKDAYGNEIAMVPEYGVLDNDLNFNKAPSLFKSKDVVLAERKKKYEEDQYKAKQEVINTQIAAGAEQARINELIKKYGKKFGTKIANGQVELGMTKNMCLAAWGEPGNIRKTATANGGTNEKWFYGRVAFLYFKGNVLAEMQE